jgi:stearoyl-CoA desaturase (delta-9 desaturase)
MPLVILGVSLLPLGGWPLLFWGVALRVTVGLRATWLVNSATHLWGSRRFATTDDSRNNWWVAL